MKQKFRDAYMKTAEVFAELSSARRLHVGAIIVKDDRIISIGYNGTPSGWDNNCENEVYIDDFHIEMTTKPEVIHAEANAILKLAQSTDSAKDSVLFVTHCPCMECVKMIISCGISAIIYKHEYRFHEQLELLRKCNIRVYNYDMLLQARSGLPIQEIKMNDRDWFSCVVCDAEFKVVSPLDKVGVAFCPFCGSEVENGFEEEDEVYDDPDPSDNF